jgi:superfamily I DNA and RNA helicase
LARQLISATEPDWWKENSRKEDDFWNEEVPLKLMDLSLDSPNQYDAIIVDEGQDFKRDWFEFLEELLVDKTQSHFAVFYDEHQDIFNHWNDLPWGAVGVPRKVLTKNCRNTKSIVGYIKKAFPCDVVPFEDSPQGVEVVERIVSGKDEVKNQLVADIKSLLDNGIDPAEIIIIPNKTKPESCIADLDRIGKYRLEWMGRSFKPRSRSIRYAGISIFKGLEANVVMVVDLDGADSDELNRLLFVEGSRARILLYIYEMETLRLLY